MNNRNNTSGKSIVLILLELLLGIGTIVGGAALMMDPSGEAIGLPLSLIENSWFTNYFVPGLILFMMLGVVPVIISVGLAKKTRSALAERLNVFQDWHWSWTFSLYSGFVLIMWIAIQAYIIHSFSMIHFMYIALGLAIQIVSLLPKVQDKYRRQEYISS
ncbi:hypothetical protein MKX64_06445 [Paenibacillus sp. FSL M8-0334]|uniref:hypothetical protein n=1 Tax=Paenibacillus sp. FSL M8-0334 TaxID=2921623 RepID=UPI0030FC6BA3